MQRGDIWTVSLPLSSGTEQGGERPAIVIQDAAYGQDSPLILIVPLTSHLAALRFPATLQIAPTTANGRNAASVATVFQARALDRARFVRRLGKLAAGGLETVLAELDRLTGR